MQLDTAMAETNAKREARRRRILENSESRLRRITARNNLDEIEDDNVLVETRRSVEKKPISEEHCVENGTFNINSEAKLQNHHAVFNDDEQEKFLANVDRDTHVTEQQVSDEHERYVNNIDKDARPLEQLSNAEYMLCMFLSNRMNLILLAGIVNILLILKLDDWFGQAVIVPYLLTMLGRLYSCKKLHEAQEGGSLLVAALILCNINPNLVYRFKVSLTLFNIILNDFGLYMFSFILMRYIITFVTTNVSMNA